MLLGLDRGMVIAARGASPAEARSRADAAEATLAREAGSALAAIRRSPAGYKPLVVMKPRREAAAVLGVSFAEAAGVVRAATEGVEAAALELEGRLTPVRVFAAGSGAGDGAGSLEGLGDIPVRSVGGARVSAAAVASFGRSADEAALARLDRADVVYLEPAAEAGRYRELGRAVDRALGLLPFASRSQGSAFRRYGSAMTSAALLALALLYLTLGAQFESFGLPLVVMATIPLALAGTGPALALSGQGLDSGSVLGLLVLSGVVVNNAILLNESFEARLAGGASPAAAAYAGASDRVRPVLATTATTVIALLPLCLSPSGAAQRSMSLAMLGGVAGSAALTVFVSPIAFAVSRRRG
jgi:multidrug efflux pump subunit AcrB